VSFAYRDGHPVLRDIDLEIPFGQFVAILGANGSGKSTLAKHINALLLPTQGDVRVGGASTADPQQVMQIRTRAGMVFQNPDNQAVASVVRDDVAFGPENLGIDPQEIVQRVHDALECVHMLDHVDDEIHSLSGGQKQRIAIAGVLAMKPEILILDEPGAMLDVRGRRGITRVAHELNQEGMTVVLITHFMEEALRADRVVVLDRGTVALDGTPAEVFTDVKRLEELRLALPFSLKLASELQARGIPVGSGLDEDELERELCSLRAQKAGQEVPTCR
jgi:energy-coupling factor transporter ATPase